MQLGNIILFGNSILIPNMYRMCTQMKPKTEHRPISKIISQNRQISLKDDTKTIISHYHVGM